MFNAETFIIGCCAGLLGIVVSLIALVPITSLIQNLSGIADLQAKLPLGYSLLLIAISIAITVVGGLIPARKAAKKDPVIALRTGKRDRPRGTDPSVVGALTRPRGPGGAPVWGPSGPAQGRPCDVVSPPTAGSPAFFGRKPEERTPGRKRFFLPGPTFSSLGGPCGGPPFLPGLRPCILRP